MFGLQDQGNPQAGDRGLTRNGGLARGLRRAAAGAVCAAAIAVPLAGAAAAQAAAAPHALTSTWTSLTLQNGWHNFVFGTAAPAVTNISGIVHLKGAIATSGTNQEPFTLPAGDRPTTAIYVPVDMGAATAGRLAILPTGVVFVASEQNWSNAQVLTSLDGVSFATSGSSFTPLTLKNGWTGFGPSTPFPAVRSSNGIVRFRGLMRTTGSNPEPFILPAAFRPNHEVYVPVTLCNANNGRLHIYPSGVVAVEAEGGTFSNAACFTSLDGAWFAKSASLFTQLTLQNGWFNYPFGTTTAAVRKISGIVHLEGAIAGGTLPQAFTLPVGFRPSHNVYVPVDLNNANKGLALIDANGQVSVFAEGSQSDATTFTSLDGVSFAP